MIKFLLKLSSLLLTVFISVQCAADTSEPKPNIIFIMADDMGYADIGPNGGEQIHTPNIDKLAAEGIRFTQAYSGNTVCAPARSTLMTGTHMGNTPVRSNSGGVSLREQDITVAQILKDAGYATGGFGKWGIAEIGQPGVPEKKGFDEFFGYYHQIHAHKFYPDYLYRNSERVDLPGNNGFYDGPLGEGKGVGPIPAIDPETGQERQYSHYLIFDEMVKFIRKNKDVPFFAYGAWTPPHSRFEMPEDDPSWKLYEDKQWPVSLKAHAAMNNMVDRNIGELMSLLEELGIDDNTIVIFTSDNGANGGMNRGPLQSNAPFRGGKTSLYEGGLRVPLIVRWPGVIETNKLSDHITYFPDMFPTLAEMAGVPDRVPEVVDGISILPELKGSKATGLKQEVHEYLYWEYADVDWNKVRYMDETLRQAVRSGDWKAIRPAPSAPLQLFNLADDISEGHNLADEYPDKVRELEKFMDEAHTPPPPQIEPERIAGRPYR
ncbi:MAG: arylsulfatase [Balneolales bacterium]